MDYSDSKEAYLHRQRDMANLPPESSIALNAIRHAQEDMKNILPPPPEPARPGILSRVWSGISVTMSEAVMPAIYKLIPQGAQEIANSLFSGTSNAYSPYGPTAAKVGEIEENQPEQASYDTIAPSPDRPAGHDR